MVPFEVNYIIFFSSLNYFSAVSVEKKNFLNLFIPQNNCKLSSDYWKNLLITHNNKLPLLLFLSVLLTSNFVCLPVVWIKSCNCFISPLLLNNSLLIKILQTINDNDIFNYVIVEIYYAVHYSWYCDIQALRTLLNYEQALEAK